MEPALGKAAEAVLGVELLMATGVVTSIYVACFTLSPSSRIFLTV